jgi:hypothetical protein
MEPKGIAKQTVAFQKNLFENSFNAMKMVQDQTEKMMETFLSQMSWVPEEGKKAISDTVEFCKKACDDFKKTVDDGFAKMEDMFCSSQFTCSDGIDKSEGDGSNLPIRTEQIVNS